MGFGGLAGSGVLGAGVAVSPLRALSEAIFTDIVLFLPLFREPNIRVTRIFIITILLLRFLLLFLTGLGSRNLLAVFAVFARAFFIITPTRPLLPTFKRERGVLKFVIQVHLAALFLGQFRGVFSDSEPTQLGAEVGLGVGLECGLGAVFVVV